MFAVRLLTWPTFCLEALELEEGASIKGWPLVMLTTGGPVLPLEPPATACLTSPFTSGDGETSFNRACSMPDLIIERTY